MEPNIDLMISYNFASLGSAFKLNLRPEKLQAPIGSNLAPEPKKTKKKLDPITFKICDNIDCVILNTFASLGSALR